MSLTPYLQSKLRRKHRSELKQLDGFLRREKNVSAEALCMEFGWSPSKARDVLWTCELLGLLKMNDAPVENLEPH